MKSFEERTKILDRKMKSVGKKAPTLARDAGVSTNTIYNFLKGKNDFTISTYEGVANALGCSFFDLIDDDFSRVHGRGSHEDMASAAQWIGRQAAHLLIERSLDVPIDRHQESEEEIFKLILPKLEEFLSSNLSIGRTVLELKDWLRTIFPNSSSNLS